MSERARPCRAGGAVMLRVEPVTITEMARQRWTLLIALSRWLETREAVDAAGPSATEQIATLNDYQAAASELGRVAREILQ